MAKFSETTRSLAVIAAVLFIATNTISFCNSTPTSVQTEAEAEAIPESNAVADIDAVPPVDDDTSNVDADNNSATSVNTALDSNCDCNDAEALYHKAIRQLIDTNVFKGNQQFLKEFRVKKICGSDGNFYSTDCEFQCTRMKQTETSDLHPVGRANCRRLGKGRVLKGKDNQRRIHHHKHVKLGKSARMQRPEKEPETLVCICPRNYFPVCASNGVTYGNKCAFECAKENINTELTIVSMGVKCNQDDETVLQ